MEKEGWGRREGRGGERKGGREREGGREGGEIACSEAICHFLSCIVHTHFILSLRLLSSPASLPCTTRGGTEVSAMIFLMRVSPSS